MTRPSPQRLPELGGMTEAGFPGAGSALPNGEVELWAPSESALCRVSAVPCSACGWGVLGMGAVVGTEHACRCGCGTYMIGDHWMLSEDTPPESPHTSASSPPADSPRTDL